VERRDAAPQWRRQYLLELRQCAHGGFFDPGHRAARRRSQPDRHRHRLLVIQKQRRQGRPRRKPIAAGGCRCRIHRVAQAAKPIDVPPQRAGGHLQAFGNLGARPVASRLKEREQSEQPGGSVQHSYSLSLTAARNCPQQKRTASATGNRYHEGKSLPRCFWT
jgi:hypothetical protein